MRGSPPSKRHFETLPAHTHYLIKWKEEPSFKVTVSKGDPPTETELNALTLRSCW